MLHAYWQTLKSHHWPVVIAILVVASSAYVALTAVPAAHAAPPTGSGPDDPLMVTGNPQTLDPNTTLWFYFDYTGKKTKIEIDLTTGGADNVALDVFTPDQAAVWRNDKSTAPVGRGTPPGANSAAAIYDLVWEGTFNFHGRFFAAVTNQNATPVTIQLAIHGDDVTLSPTPTPTPLPYGGNPFATPVPVGALQGTLLFQDASGGNIYTVKGDGSNLTRLTYGLDPTWSPDKKQIAFARWDSPAGLYIANADGTQAHPIFSAAQLIAPRWSPDGSHIAFTQQKGGPGRDRRVCYFRFCFTLPANPYWKLGLVDSGGGNFGEPPCTNHCYSPAWSADGHTLLYADDGFGILTTDTLSRAQDTLYNQSPKVQSPVVSPDGTRVAFQLAANDHWDILVVTADGRQVTAVTQADPFSFTKFDNVAPAWSPDGNQVLFLSNRNGKWEFFVADASGANLKQALKSVTDAMPIQYNYSNEHVVEWSR